MSLCLQPRAAPGNQLRVWLGAFGRTAAPGLLWSVNGEARAPDVLRPMESARDATMVDPETPRVFTGIYQFSEDIRPGSWYEVRVQADDGHTTTLKCRTLPEEVPSTFESPFNVLLVSCFHAHEDRGGLAGQLVSGMNGPLRPHLSLLLGDQVYLDLPTLRNFPDDRARLAEIFEADYTANWSTDPGYAGILRAAPSASTPDDHEYWNNFPHASPIVQNSWTQGGRERWGEAAKAMYGAFQLAEPEGFERAVEIDVRPLSFFLLDTRTFRDLDRRHSVHPRVLDQFVQWCGRVAEERLFGVLVSGQSFFDDAAGDLTGKVADRTLANYGDHGAIVAELAALADAGRPVLLITGDVHWGRVIETRDRHRARAKFYEVISSPTSLVSTVGADQVKTLGASIRGIFGARPEWPRHGDPRDPPPFFAAEELGRRFESRPPLHIQKGNHVTTLSFTRAGLGLDLHIRYWPIFPEGRFAPPTRLKTIHLAPAA